MKLTFDNLQNLELTRSLEHKSGEVVTLLNLGTTYELLNKLDQAIEWYTLVSKIINTLQIAKIENFMYLCTVFELDSAERRCAGPG